ncbi:putative hydro-lyase [Stappia sp. ES.058]|uniref:putative hydro-lyase n=1 Tax=Stappia sp. ES.058 TaxID=1881061 RepID=UPI000B8205D8|nr:putative hydro-lyase [Stappia sp. ES.058]
MAKTQSHAASDLRSLSPADLRRAIRAGDFRDPTAGCAAGSLQGNLAILPSALADDFLRYCLRNPKPCPVIGLSEPGDPTIPALGRDLDIRTDIGAYRIFEGGSDGYRSVADLGPIWRDDLVSFVLGCSFSFEAAILRAGIALPHIANRCNVAMYVTSLMTQPSGPFSGPMVVSMRAFRAADAIQAVLLSDRYRLAHGAPVHIGDPAEIGIADLSKPDFGDAPMLQPDEIPVFWACGVTPQMAIRTARPDIAITHEPGHMLVTDLSADAAEFSLGSARQLST